MQIKLQAMIDKYDPEGVDAEVQVLYTLKRIYNKALKNELEKKMTLHVAGDGWSYDIESINKIIDQTQNMFKELGFKISLYSDTINVSSYSYKVTQEEFYIVVEGL